MVPCVAPLNLESAALFLDVVRLGSLSAAATENLVSKSMVKRHIDSLEAFAGTPLLVRGARGTEMTAAGEVFAARVEAILRSVESLRQECSTVSARNQARTIRIAFYSDFVFPMVQYCCDHYALAHPNDTIQPVFTTFAHAHDGVRDGLFDVALCARPSASKSVGLGCTTLYATRMGAYVSAGGPLAQKEALSRADLADHETAIHSMWCSAEELREWSHGGEGRVPFELNVVSGGIETMQEVVSRGGIYLYPETDSTQFPYRFVPLEDPVLSWSTIVHASQPSQAVLDFVHETVEYLGPYTNAADLRMRANWSTRPE